MAFIITTYNKYNQWDRAHSRYTFEINGQQYAIMEVGLEWGQPQLQLSIEKDDNPGAYRLYSTYNDALQFVKHIRHLNK